jgi:lipoate-protein ligase A
LNNTIQIWNSGLADGSWNVSFDLAWLALHAKGDRPGLLRFHRSRPTASIGRHQALGREIRLGHCRQHDIETVRRTSGGGALYLDENQQGVSLIFRRPTDWSGLRLAQILARFCAALADGLAHLGIQAHFKAPNDLEIDGRKLASAFVAIQGDSLLLHATLLCDADIKAMLETLRVPTEKLTVTGLESARQRLVTLREVLGEVPPDTVLQQALRQGLENAFNVGWVDARKPNAIDENRVSPALSPACIDWSDDDTALEALHKTPGGVLRVHFWPDAKEKIIARLQFAGDLNLHPSDVLERLQRALTGLPLAQAEPTIRAFFAENVCDLAGFAVDDICHLLQLALNKLYQQREMGLSTAQANSLMVLANGIESDAPAILAQASVMLLPYCAKPAWCKWRHQDDCVECGKCEVGDAYRLARERNMQVTTITHYEHLTATLAEMKNKGVEAYVGACCSQFFIKRHHAFREAGMAAVLMDISGANCYELKQEETAYAGRFEAEARLDADMLAKVMQHVPAAPVRGTRVRRVIPLNTLNEIRKLA